MSLHFLNYRYRHATFHNALRMQPSEVRYRHSDERRSRETGENCIDNMAIAWMAAVNLSLYMICWHRERRVLTTKCRANGKSRALSR